MKKTLAQRLAERTDLEGENGCWIYTGKLGKNGYGYIGVDGKTKLAHRVSYELSIGPIPEGLQLDHLCRVRSCINPDHLEPVTNRENGLRGISFAAQNVVKTHCPLGHPYDDDNTRVRSTKYGWQRRDCKACGPIGAHRRAVESRTAGDHVCTVCDDRFTSTRGLRVHLSQYHGIEGTPHGTRSKYVMGCRCDECREANYQYGVLFAARRRKAA